jgi:hypothetical protein
MNLFFMIVFIFLISSCAPLSDKDSRPGQLTRSALYHIRGLHVAHQLLSGSSQRPAGQLIARQDHFQLYRIILLLR